MSVVNVNARQLGNGAIFVQYQQDGKSKDAAFTTWSDFVSWLAALVLIPTDEQPAVTK